VSGPTRAWCVLAGFMLLATATACATTTVPSPPRLRVDVTEHGASGDDCHARIDIVRGARPEDTRVIATIVVTADRPTSLESLEQAAIVPAVARCAEGLNVLRAEAADGASGVMAITAVAWGTAHTDVEPTSSAAVPSQSSAPPATK
jgi:hypothetical protein